MIGGPEEEGEGREECPVSARHLYPVTTLFLSFPALQTCYFSPLWVILIFHVLVAAKCSVWGSRLGGVREGKSGRKSLKYSHGFHIC